MLKRSLSLILAVVMLLAVFTVLPASAEEASKDNIAAEAVTEASEDNSVVEPTAEVSEIIAEIEAVKKRDAELAPIGVNGNDEDYEGLVKSSYTDKDGNTFYYMYYKNWYENEYSSAIIVGADIVTSEVTIPAEIDGVYVGLIDWDGIGEERLPETVIIPDTEDYDTLFIYALPATREVIVTADDDSVLIFSNSIGYRYHSYDEKFGTYETEKIDDFTIKGYRTSNAEKYAKVEGFNFVALSRGVPEIAGFETTNKGIKITWEPFEGNKYYRVYRKTMNSGWKRLAQVEGTTYVDSNISEGYYYYTLRCVDEDGNFTSDFYQNGWLFYYYLAPDFKVCNVSSGLLVTWDVETGEVLDDIYVLVYRKTNDTSWQRIYDSRDDFEVDDSFDNRFYLFGEYYLDKDVEPGVKYTYTVRLIDSVGTFLSGYQSGKSGVYSTVPEITDFENVNGGIKLTWTKFAGAAKYRVYRKQYDYSGSWTLLASVNNTSYIDTKVEDREWFVYTVRALDSKDKFISDYDHLGWERCYIEPPVIDKIYNSVNGITLTWSDFWPDYPDTCIVYRKTDNSSWQRLAKVYGGSYTDTTAQNGVRYTYTLRIVDDEGNFLSSHNAGKSITRIPPYPMVTSIENTVSGAKIKWNAYKGAASYRVYYKSGNSWTRIASTTKTEYVDTSVKSGTTRVYTVRALDKNGKFVSEFKPQGWSNTFVSAPVVSLSNTEKGVNISWAACAGAVRYRVYYYANNTWNRMAETTGTSYVDTNVKSGNTYTYTVRCISADSKSFTSAHNSGKSIQYVAAPKITSIENTATGVKIKWSVEKGAASYRVYYKSGSSWVRIAATTKTEYVDTSVKDGETRVYTIRCLNSKEAFVSDFNHEGWSNTYVAP